MRGRSTASARPARWLSALAAVAVAATACGSSTTSPSTTTTTINTATANAEVEHAYDTLFNLADKSVDAKLAVVQDGASLRSAMQEALSSSLAAAAGGATVHQVSVLSPRACGQAAEPSPCARVTYDIVSSSGGAPVQAGAKGYAVLIGGNWLVSKNTVCGLFQLLYTTEGKKGTPPGC